MLSSPKIPLVRIMSVIEGRDPDVLDAMFGFYHRPAGRVVDLTCNRRRMWKGLNADGVTFCDINPVMAPDVVCDFRATPFSDAEVSMIVFDPPHLPAAAGSAESHDQYRTDYGLAGSLKADNVSGFFRPFLVEASRILMPDGLAFCKLTDFVHNHRYQWTLVDFVGAVRAVPGLTATDLIVKRDPCAGNLKSGRWEKSHHARRACCWWIVVRKGKCEPSSDYPPQMVGRKISGDRYAECGCSWEFKFHGDYCPDHKYLAANVVPAPAPAAPQQQAAAARETR